MAERASQINITLGTAGHIDHGKTALIRLLTGCETDRLKQEKDRGMSIELGFAPCQLGDLEVGIVDVPGHENFIKTMVAGAAGIDGVIFVVAADDSIMPQTREHLDILTLLGVRYGLVALTKIDMVTPERIQVVADELKQYLKGTFLEQAPICPISSITGEGFDGFYKSLKSMIGGIRPRSTEGIFRLPVERTFSVKGFGTVISGIPACGSAKIGGEVVLLPQGQKSRIKAIQVYGRESDVVQSGQCAALNLPQIDYKTVQRGNVLTQGVYFQASRWFLCVLNSLENGIQKVKNGTRLKFHTGTSETAATVYLLESDTLQPGQETLIQIRTEHPVVAGPNDRFILRSLSPVHTLGGGGVIEAVERKIKRSKGDIQEDLLDRAQAVREPGRFIEYCIEHAPAFAVSVRDIAIRVKLSAQKVQGLTEQLIEQGTVFRLASDLYMHTRTGVRLTDMLLRNIEQHHKNEPGSPGAERDKLLEQCGLEKKVFDGLVVMLLGQQKLIVRKNRIALPSHAEQFPPHIQKLLDTVEAMYRSRLFNPPNVEEVIAQRSQPAGEMNKIIRILVEQQVLVCVEQGLFFHADAIEEAKRRTIDYVNGEGAGRLESVQFKYLLDTTRKYAIPLLDYMDKIGVTRRVGNTRYLK